MDADFRKSARRFLSDCVHLMHGDEGSFWIAAPGGQELVITLNTGARAADLEGVVQQPLTEGVVSEAFRTGGPVSDDGVRHSPHFSHLIDTAIGQHTFYVTAAPVLFAGQPIGVLSVVQVAALERMMPRRTVWGFPAELPVLWNVATAGFGVILESLAWRMAGTRSDG